MTVEVGVWARNEPGREEYLRPVFGCCAVARTAVAVGAQVFPALVSVSDTLVVLVAAESDAVLVPSEIAAVEESAVAGELLLAVADIAVVSRAVAVVQGFLA